MMPAVESAKVLSFAGLALLGVSVSSSVEYARAATVLDVTINTSQCAGTSADFVFGFVSGSSSANTAHVFAFATDGQRGQARWRGGPVHGSLVVEAGSPYEATIQASAFENRLVIPMAVLGTTVSFSVELTETGPASGGMPDQFAFHVLSPDGSSLLYTVDPTWAHAVFAIGVTGAPGGAMDVFAPAVLASGNQVSLTLCASPGGGGCPFVDARTIRGWEVENSISARSATDALSHDVYRLKSALRPSDGRVQVRIRENEQEFTTLDEVRLVAVDHSPDVRAFPLRDRIVLGSRVPAFRVTTSSGADITKLVDGTGEFYQARAGDTLLVDMTPPQTHRGFGVESIADGGGPGSGEMDPKEMEAPQIKSRMAMPLGVVDESILSTTGVLVQRSDGHGGWRTVVHHYPRQYRDEALFDSLGSDRVRLVFVGKHRLYFFGRIVESSSQAVPQVLTLLSADHCRLGNAKAAVSQSGDGTTLLAPGDTLTLTFSSPPIPSGRVRDWFIQTRGVYSSAAPLSHQPGSEERPLPISFALRQNRPNPFTERTTIHFELPVRAAVRLQIFDAQGRLIRTLADGGYSAGFHALDWVHRTDRGQALGAGVYLYRIQAGAFRDQRKMVLLAR